MRDLRILSLTRGEPTNSVAKATSLAKILKEYQLALHLRPDEAELHEAFGEFYLDNHHHDEEAEAELQKVLSLDPSAQRFGERHRGLTVFQRHVAIGFLAVATLLGAAILTLAVAHLVTD
jgi:tetratricopeptide (TPR) repeat protein